MKTFETINEQDKFCVIEDGIYATGVCPPIPQEQKTTNIKLTGAGLREMFNLRKIVAEEERKFWTMWATIAMAITAILNIVKIDTAEKLHLLITINISMLLFFGFGFWLLWYHKDR